MLAYALHAKQAISSQYTACGKNPMNKSSLNFSRYLESLLWKVPGATKKTLDNKEEMKRAMIPVIKVTHVYFLIFSKYGSCVEFIIRDLKL